MVQVIKADNRKPFCECGAEATVWTVSGEGCCEQCIKADYMTRLSSGHAVTINGSGKPKWALIPMGHNAFGQLDTIMLVRIQKQVTLSGRWAIDDAWDIMRGQPTGTSAQKHQRSLLTFHEFDKELLRFDESQAGDIPVDDDDWGAP